MGFHDEEELESWYAEQKDKLEESFMKAVEGKVSEDNTGARVRYTTDLKKLIVKYQQEYEKLLPKMFGKK